MAHFPTCVSCLSTDSEVDVEGVCVGCSTRGSVRDTRAESPPAPPPRLKAFEADATRTDGDPTPPPDRPRPAAATRFPEYTDLILLERGGMGVVYRAKQVRTGRTVALKTMNVAAHGDDRQGRRFRTEAEALARLSHPGIVQIFEASEQDGVPYLAMEFVPGGSLAKRLRAGPPVSAREAAELAGGVASALAAAHARGITHRDVKPSNVLLTAAGKPKLTDFGLACLADAASRITQPGSTIGTPAYMAPEQANPKSFGPVGPAADVYGLGATLYEMLTGQPPFAGDTAVEVLYQVCHTPVVPPRSVHPAVPADLEAICLRCLEKRPDDRFASAALVANALSRFLRGEPVGGPTLAFRAKKLSRRYGKVAAAGLAVAVLAGLMGAAIMRDPAKPDPAAAYVAAQARDLDARREILLTPAPGIPPYAKWIRGDTALRSNDHVRGDGGFGFLAAVNDHFPSLLELVPSTRADSYTITGEIMMRDGGNTESFVGIYLMEPGDDVVRRTRVVGFKEHARPVDEGKVSFVIRDYLTCYRVGSVNPAHMTYDSGDLTYTPYGEKPKAFRPITIVVTRERIEATLGGMTDPDSPGTRSVQTRLDTDTPHRRKVARLIFDGDLLTRGRPLVPMPPRGAIGLFAENSEIAVRDLRLKPIPTP